MSAANSSTVKAETLRLDPRHPMNSRHRWPNTCAKPLANIRSATKSGLSGRYWKAARFGSVLSCNSAEQIRTQVQMDPIMRCRDVRTASVRMVTCGKSRNRSCREKNGHRAMRLALSITPSISLRRKRKSRNEVVLTIHIMHRSDFNREVDDCEDRCLKEMQQHLHQLGIVEGMWHEPPEQIGQEQSREII